MLTEPGGFALSTSLQHPNRGLATRGFPVIGGDFTPNAAPSLVEVLWRRRAWIGITIAACLLIAISYLLVADRVYAATARLRIAQTPPRTFADTASYVERSEDFLQTQAEVVESISVLQRTLDSIDWQSMRTFAGARDPVRKLKRSIKVEPSRKADLLSITIESTYPEEARALVSAVVDAFIFEQTEHRRQLGDQMVQVLMAQRDQLRQTRDETLARISALRDNLGVVGLPQHSGSTMAERTQTLATALTTAEMQVIELQAEYEAAQKMLSDPQAIAAFIEARQSQGRDAGDSELSNLRQQLTQHEMALSALNTSQGENHPRARAIQEVIAGLRERIAHRQRDLAEAHASSLRKQLQVATDKVAQLRETLRIQRGMAADANPHMAEFLKLQAELDRLQRQDELLSHRIAEVSVNSMNTGPLSIQVLEQMLEPDPVRPNKMLALGAALLVGWVVGIGAALLREWQDTSLRTPEEIPTSLGTALLAMVPRVNPRLSPVARGQLVHLDSCSAAAEAYRSIRTSLSLGGPANARTFLVASPASGDGKSTTASNIAIAFAQAGERTLLIDCDLRNPVQHLIFELDGVGGVTTVIAGQTKLRDAIRPSSVPGLYVLPCGPVPRNPSELLAGARFKSLLQKLSETFDRIIIDSPPLMSVTDARILAAEADATVLVMRMNRSMRELGIMALDSLDAIGARVVGAVANDVPASQSAKYYGGNWPYVSRATKLIESKPSRPTVNGHNGTGVAAVEPDDEQPPDLTVLPEPEWLAGRA